MVLILAQKEVVLKIAEGRQMSGDIDNAVVDTYKFAKTNFDIDKD